jgi:ectoine hydroxylase-related dioxygenase (phytanoyl-CoA dioxygenase family)
MNSQSVEMKNPSLGKDLNGFRELSQEEVISFREKGFILLREVLEKSTLEAMEREISKRVAEHYDREASVKGSGSYYADAFQQISNIWEIDEVIQQLVFSEKLASVATQLLGTKGVRLYHDQALYKESGRNHTPWHCDQVYWPLSNENTVTAWIPLQDTPVDMGALGFAQGSHRKHLGRDLTISKESETTISNGVKEMSYSCEPFSIGDISFHYGFTLHNAAANTSGAMRRVMTVIYMDSEMRVKELRTDAHRSDLERWIPGRAPGDLCDSPLNPVLYTAS